MEKPYDKIIANFKRKHNYINEIKEKEGYDLNKSDMTWATVLVASLELLEKEKISIEDAIQHLHKEINFSGKDYADKHYRSGN
ncbi:hypothetical protein [Staphylococcus caprae]|uniref:hypothetical protein n=1 Tax=Staphylococcus caprae TaxID=29380 RepID=UPI003B21D731